MQMKAIILAAGLLMASFQAKADPILTPLVATAFTTVGISATSTIAGFSAVALTTSALTLGAVSNPSALKVTR